MPVASVRFGPFVFGPNTLWLGLHGFLMFVILVFSAFLFGAIFFTGTPDARTVRRLKVSAAVTFGARLLLMISGIIPDIGSARCDRRRQSAVTGQPGRWPVPAPFGGPRVSTDPAPRPETTGTNREQRA